MVDRSSTQYPVCPIPNHISFLEVLFHRLVTIELIARSPCRESSVAYYYYASRPLHPGFHAAHTLSSLIIYATHWAYFETQLPVRKSRIACNKHATCFCMSNTTFSLLNVHTPQCFNNWDSRSRHYELSGSKLQRFGILFHKISDYYRPLVLLNAVSKHLSFLPG